MRKYQTKTPVLFTSDDKTYETKFGASFTKFWDENTIHIHECLKVFSQKSEFCLVMDDERLSYCVCVCVCVREREEERERKCVCLFVCLFVCVGECVWVYV